MAFPTPFHVFLSRPHSLGCLSFGLLGILYPTVSSIHTTVLLILFTHGSSLCSFLLCCSCTLTLHTKHSMQVEYEVCWLHFCLVFANFLHSAPVFCYQTASITLQTQTYFLHTHLFGNYISTLLKPAALLIQNLYLCSLAVKGFVEAFHPSRVLAACSIHLFSSISLSLKFL